MQLSGSSELSPQSVEDQMRSISQSMIELEALWKWNHIQARDLTIVTIAVPDIRNTSSIVAVELTGVARRRFAVVFVFPLLAIRLVVAPPSLRNALGLGVPAAFELVTEEKKNMTKQDKNINSYLNYFS